MFYKKLAAVMCRPLSIIFQQSFFQKIVPNDWKLSVVLQLYKGKGLRTNPLSYRGISLEPSISKIMERIISEQLSQHLESCGLLSDAQHGFRPGRSCMTNLLAFEAELADCLRQDIPCDVIIFDFAKAFDRLIMHCCSLNSSILA